jgi:hypothetical protein
MDRERAEEGDERALRRLRIRQVAGDILFACDRGCLPRSDDDQPRLNARRAKSEGSDRSGTRGTAGFRAEAYTTWVEEPTRLRPTEAAGE